MDDRDKKIFDIMENKVFHLHEVEDFFEGGIVIVDAANYETDNILKNRNINFVRAESSIVPFVNKYCKYLLSL